ncbi:hypothetical protein [Burkholderia sp. AU32262]|uniref:hypothetical protein n=1 Tax=Burkholderia sp. AU32262 TaxID=2879630 RepID=UPI001CF4589F|nr:hypothetical protein [Burkholderia sp. AU32262]MCA8241796.1 hypothetical protein [Burkholderia sp. AU32262]
MLTIAKIFWAAVLVIAIPIIASWFAVAGIPKWSETVKVKETAISRLREHATNASSGRITVAVVFVLLLQGIGTINWRQAITVEDGVQWLFIVSFGGVAASLYFGCRVLSDSSLATCPGCQWLWGLLVLVAIWFGRARTQTDLATIFGAVSDKLPLASNVGVFLRAFGHVSLAMAVVMLLAEGSAVVLYFGFEQIFGKSVPENETSRARGWIALFNTFAVMLSAGLSLSAASVLAFNDQPVRSSVGRIAFETDLLPESACTGRSKDKDNANKVLFRSDDREQAIVFALPSVPSNHVDATRPRVPRPIIKWQPEDYAAVTPKAIAIDRDCKLID